jgi:hypothetical protein
VHVPYSLIYPGHNWLHLQAAKETKQTHHAETNKKVTSHTRSFKDRLPSEACVSKFPYSCMHCPDLPPKPIRIFESVRISRLDTQHSSLVRHNRHEKMWLVLKAECRFTCHASRFQNLIRTSTRVMDTECAKSGSKFCSFHMSSWAVSCHLCRLPVPSFLQGTYFCASHPDCHGPGKYLNFLLSLIPTALYISITFYDQGFTSLLFNTPVFLLSSQAVTYNTMHIARSI